MTILSNTEIFDEYTNSKKIIIHPFNVKNINTSSYDVTLGQHYYQEKRPFLPSQDNFFNIYNEEDIKKIWIQKKALKKESWQHYYDIPNWNWNNIADNDEIILLAPGTNILAHTNEFIGGKYDITTMMKARSSYGRSMITACYCAGMGDVGYINRWTMEITNHSQYYHIPLIVGRRIAQIVFMRTGPTNHISYEGKGNYQDKSDLDELIKNWTPDQMLPKLYRERK